MYILNKLSLPKYINGMLILINWHYVFRIFPKYIRKPQFAVQSIDTMVIIVPPPPPPQCFSTKHETTLMEQPIRPGKIDLLVNFRKMDTVPFQDTYKDEVGE